MESVGNWSWQKEEIVKEKILVRVCKRDDKDGILNCFRYSELFTINLRTHEISESPYILYNDYGSSNTMVSLGSTVFVVGGVVRVNVKPPNSTAPNYKKGTYHKGMSYLDPNPTGNGGWIQAPLLGHIPSPDPAVATLGGKIYMFTHTNKAGIFDPLTNQWETLLLPGNDESFDLVSSFASVADPGKNRVFVYFANLRCFYAYYPLDRCWKRQYLNLPWSYQHQAFIANDVFYSYSPDSPQLFMAYDIEAKKRLSIVFTCEVDAHVRRHEYSQMLYLGKGHLCLVKASYKTVFIAKFSVERSNADDQLLLTPFPLQTYTLSTSGCYNVFFPL